MEKQEELKISTKNNTMNRNLLENFRAEAAGLKVKQNIINAADLNIRDAVLSTGVLSFN